MSTNLLEQLRIYGEDFEANMSPVTLDELVRDTEGPVRVQPLNKQIRRPIPGWVSAVTAAAVVLLIGGVAFLLRDSGGQSAPATSTPTTVAPATVTETADPITTAGWSRVVDDDGVFGGSGETGMASVTVGGPGLVAVGRDGADAAVWTSVDGSVWSRIPNSESVFADASMSSVIASESLIVAVGAGDVPWAGKSRPGSAIVWTSLDGNSWTRVAFDETVFGGATMADITAGGPGFVAVGSTCCDGDPRERDADGGPKDSERDAVVWTSVDGKSWSRVAHDETVFGGVNNQDMISITAGGPGLVAVGYDGTHVWDDPNGTAAAWTSVDGLAWSRVPPDESVFDRNSSMVSVTAGGPGLVAVGYEFGCRRPIWTSADGIVWSRVPLDVPGACNKPITSVIVDNERLVAVGLGARSWTSNDGITWTEIARPRGGFKWMRSVTASDLGLVAVGSIENEPGRNIKDLPVRLDADGDPITPPRYGFKNDHAASRRRGHHLISPRPLRVCMC